MGAATAARKPQGGSAPQEPPAPQRTWLRNKHAVLREGTPETVTTLRAGFDAGARTPWTLPWDRSWRTWSAPVSARLLVAFLGWLVEGSLALRRRAGGRAALERVVNDNQRPRWVLGTRWDWVGLLGLASRRTVTRLVELCEELELVERERTRVQVAARRAMEDTPAYRPGPALLEWLQTGSPPWAKGKNVSPPESSPPQRGEELPSVLPSPEGGQIGTSPATTGGIATTPRLARVVGRIGGGCLAASAPQAAATVQSATGRGVSEASRGEASQEARRLHGATPPAVSASPATPPATPPPGGSGDDWRAAAAELAATGNPWAAMVVGAQLDLPGTTPPAVQLELAEVARRRAEFEAREGGKGGAS